MYEKYIDHTNLKPDSTYEDIKKLVNEALEYKFATVCVNPCRVKISSEMLKDTEVGVTTVIGFPLGANTIETKVFETTDAIKNGATEIDMVINIGKLREKDSDYLKEEISRIKEACKDKVLKVIIETALLDEEEKILISSICIECGVDYVKTSTGFNGGGATVEDVKLIKSIVKDKCKIKASGGIRDREFMEKLIDAGADRIGASASVKLIK